MENPIERRDRASARVRRLTTAAVAGAAVLTAAFAGLAAGSTHTAKKVVKRAVTRPAQSPVTAPTPQLVPSGSNITPAAPQSQAPAVTPSAAAPVVVAGGS